MRRQEVIAIIETARKMSQWPNLSKTDLAFGIDLSELDLSKADLSFTDLRGAELMGANLRKAKLNQANLSGLGLHGVEITKKQVMTAENIEGVILPDGTPAITPLDLFDLL